MKFYSNRLAVLLLISTSVASCGGGGPAGSDDSKTKQSESSASTSIDDIDSDGVPDELDFDKDGDGLIEVGTLQDLSSIRQYSDSIVSARSNVDNGSTIAGCPQAGCIGFELTQDLYFPVEQDRETGVFWNNGLGWEPIGDENSPFTGDFSGNGYSIHNLYINRPEQTHVGLFGHIDNGSIYDISVVNAEIHCDSVCSALVGELRLIDSSIKVSNIHVVGDVSSSLDDTGLAVGRMHLQQSSNHEIDRIRVEGSISSGGNRTGGVFGSVLRDSPFGGTLTIQDLDATVNIQGLNETGGIVGNIDLSAFGSIFKIMNVNVEDSVISGRNRVGGAFGNLRLNASRYDITDVDVRASMSCNRYCGGVIGDSLHNTLQPERPNLLNNLVFDGTIDVENKYYEGDLLESALSGGIVGSLSANGAITVESCSSKGELSADESRFAKLGGLVGDISAYFGSEARVINSSANMSISGYGFSIGGLIGNFSRFIGEPATIVLSENSVLGTIDAAGNHAGGLAGSIQIRGNSGQAVIEGNVIEIGISFPNDENTIGGLLGKLSGNARITGNVVESRLISENVPNDRLLAYGYLGGLIGGLNNNFGSLPSNEGYSVDISGNLVLTMIYGRIPVGGLIGSFIPDTKDSIVINANLVKSDIQPVDNLEVGKFGSFIGSTENSDFGNVSLSYNYVVDDSSIELIGDEANSAIDKIMVAKRSLDELKCPTVVGDGNCDLTLFSGWDQVRYANKAVWNFGSQDMAPGIQINGFVYRDNDGDLKVDK